MEKFAEKETVMELKRELRRAIDALAVDDDDDADGCDLGITDIAIETLCALKELKLKPSDGGFMKLNNLQFQEPPHEFRCPISGSLMKDPVVAASGQTFEKLSIQKWLKEGNKKCPQTDQPLPHNVLIPNHSIKNMIVNWCKTSSKGDELRSGTARVEEFGVNSTKENLMELLEKLSSPLDQMAAMRELRLLTSRLPSFRALFGEINGAISRLLCPVLIERCYSDAAFYEDVVTTLLNISTDHSNRTKILEGCPLVISFLSEALRSKNIETRGRAAAALSALSTVDSKKLVIGESGAIKALIELLKEGNPLILRDAASALLNLCTLIENTERAVIEGVITVVIDKIIACVYLDEMLDILARLCSHQRAIEEMEERSMISCLVSILREDVSEQSKEKCVAILYAMCFRDPRGINRVENAQQVLCLVAGSGTSRARRKATDLLERMNRIRFGSYYST